MRRVETDSSPGKVNRISAMSITIAELWYIDYCSRCRADRCRWLPPRTIAVAEPVTRDQARLALRLKSGDLGGVQGKKVSLRLSLRKAQLYFFWSE